MLRLRPSRAAWPHGQRRMGVDQLNVRPPVDLTYLLHQTRTQVLACRSRPAFPGHSWAWYRGSDARNKMGCATMIVDLMPPASSLAEAVRR